jgi:CubicO group peptidase (beta-lactamase class C family)
MRIVKIGIIILAVLIIIGECWLWYKDKMFVNKVLYSTILQGKLGPDIDERDDFPHHVVDAPEKPQPWPIVASMPEMGSSLLSEMEEYKTVSYLVIQHDSILYEKHWENYGEQSYANSFSAAKSFTSMLIGVAIKEGLIKSTSDKVGDYLPEFKEGEKSKLRIRHLLTMSSGLGFDETYMSPLGWPSEAYYGPNVNELTLSAELVKDIGKYWEYKGGDSQLLGMILKEVTGKTVAAYASEKLWKPMGAEYPAYWSTDEKGMEKVSCCWYSNARDFARFARLMMRNGNWNGQQLIDSSYVAESIQPASELLDEEGQNNNRYGYQWWLMEYMGNHIYYARGIRGQYIFAIPEKDMIVVRLGHKRAPKAGHNIPKDVYVYLDAALSIAKDCRK